VRINKWIDDVNARSAEMHAEIESVTPWGPRDVLVVYTRQESVLPENNKPSLKRLEPLPLKEGARSPTWKAVMRDQEGEREAPVMAGVFSVPEGFKMHPEDDEPAPPVLLAKGTDLSPYVELFGNIKPGTEVNPS
jgi:hypothetical protein